MTKNVKWGIIGLGSIAHKFAADLQIVHNAVLEAVASRSVDKAKKFANQYHANEYYADYELLVEKSNVDIVYIATPNTYHFSHTMMCLKYNKAVLCEKPMGVNSHEVKSMIDKARSRNLFLMEAIWTRFIPAIEKLLALLEANFIGKLISVDANFGFYNEFDAESRLFNKQLGGGSLLDIGIYPIYLSFLALGFPFDINAIARMSSTQVDQSCYMLFNFENESKAQLSSTFEADTTNEAYIYGSKGNIRIKAPFHHPQQIECYLYDGEKEEFNIPYRGHGYVHEILAVHHCLDQKVKEHPQLNLEISLAISQIIDAIKGKIGLSYTNVTE